MIDLGLLRQQPEYIIEQIKKKDPNFNIVNLIELDKKVREYKSLIEDLRCQKNELASLNKDAITQEIKDQARQLSQELKQKEKEYNIILEEFNNLYLYCPNVLLEDVPTGGKESNIVVKVAGEKPIFDFKPKNHLELGVLNHWFDFAAASSMTGHNFALYKNQAVKVVYALMIYMLNNNIKHGFTPYLPPYLINEESLLASSNFPRFKDEVYKVEQENLYLTPTAEVNLTNIYRDRILSSDQLPINMTAWTSCFRKEAGTYGAQERGLIRLHQFEKVELYTICDPENSVHELDRMIACAENILQDLGLHYRISLLAAQDTSFQSAKTYDIEVWMPGQNEYKEVSSSSTCTDFQARRAAIRYKTEESKKAKLVHTLNASSLALPRLMVALMETYQQEDGTIALPEVLKSVSLEIKL